MDRPVLSRNAILIPIGIITHQTEQNKKNRQNWSINKDFGIPVILYRSAIRPPPPLVGEPACVFLYRHGLLF